MSFHYSALSAAGSDDSLNRRGFIHQDYLDHDANFEDEHGKDHTTKVSSKLPVETNPIILLSILHMYWVFVNYCHTIHYLLQKNCIITLSTTF